MTLKWYCDAEVAWHWSDLMTLKWHCHAEAWSFREAALPRTESNTWQSIDSKHVFC